MTSLPEPDRLRELANLVLGPQGPDVHTLDEANAVLHASKPLARGVLGLLAENEELRRQLDEHERTIELARENLSDAEEHGFSDPDDPPLVADLSLIQWRFNTGRLPLGATEDDVRLAAWRLFKHVRRYQQEAQAAITRVYEVDAERERAEAELVVVRARTQQLEEALAALLESARAPSVLDARSGG